MDGGRSAAGGVDSTALLIGDYSNGNDGLVSKDASSIEELEGETVHLVELSVSHYLLARALASVGLEERDLSVVNISDADLVSAFQTDDVRHVATWNPLLSEVEAYPGATKLFDSSQIPGHIKDLTIVNTETLRDNPALGKALVGAGTVLTPDQVDAVQQAGGQLIISPNSNLSVIARSAEAGLISMPGYFTPTEAFAAVQAGASALKLFPAEAATPTVLKAQRAVLPKELPVLAVGGINPGNMGPWVAAGADGFGLGSALYKPGATVAQVREAAQAFLQGWKAATD